ncbi:MAG: XTP/dITP diphosphatase [Syntrophomonadaceae bacterium]|nr:XTP/dITP diphosphatase [Syntrophomonadaceae bacterium]
MKTKLLIASRNQKKKKELQQILSGLNFELLSLDDLPPLPEVEEDGTTFAENAIKKAVTVARQTGLLALADDSGLVVDALQGAPGVFSARYSDPEANDEKNNRKLLLAMQDIPDADRSARFVCVIALAEPDGQVQTVQGICEGRIDKVLKGSAGFGYDPLFIPDGFEESFAQLDPSIKNTISHRGQALEFIKPVLEKINMGGENC